jgi:hypothetical protein
MGEAGFLSLLAPWVGGAGGALLMAPPPPPLPPPRVVDSQDLLARMLRRLPPSLWDIDPLANTLQRDLYRAFATEMALWLEQRAIARTMTLLLEAQGVDLDILMQDFGLRRYLQRPDAYARQVAMHILWMPQGTLASVDRLADLLFELPHVTLRTGRSQQHILLAATHPVTTPYSYWGLVSAEGRWYAVTVHHSVPIITPMPPPGLDVSPGPHTLTWFTVTDALATPWYVSIAEDTLRLEATPPAGYGTAEPFMVLDGAGQRWGLTVDRDVLVSVLETGLAGFGFWRVRSHNATVYALWIDKQVATIGTAPPGGSTDQTPGGAPLDWLTVVDAFATPWYLSIEDDTLVLTPTVPGGTGTATLAEWLDVHGQRWVLTADHGTLLATAAAPVNAALVVTAPEAPFEAFQLLDTASQPWWISVDHGTLAVTLLLPAGASDVTAAGGAFHWWRVYDQAGTLFSVWPSTAGVLVMETTNPGGLGTAQPQTLGDRHGVLWHVGVGRGMLGISDAPPVAYTGHRTAICMTDETGGRWFWRVHKQVLEWSPVLWPDTIDQSPWGDLGWLQLLNTEGEVRYVFATPQGSARAAAAPPVTLPWGWREPWTFLDAAGTPWHFTVLPDDRVGVLPALPDDLPLPASALPLGEALEAFSHIQAAGSALTILVK